MEMKVFSAWIIPGIVIPSYTLTRPANEAFPLIMEILSKRYSKKIYVILGNSKEQEVVYIRQLCVYFLKSIYKSSLTDRNLSKWMGVYIRKSTRQIFQDRIDTEAKLPLRYRHLAKNTKEDYLITEKLLRQCL